MTKPLRMFAALAAAGALALTACGGGAATTDASSAPAGDGSAASSYRIGVLQIQAHPSLDAARDGFKAALADAGIEASYDEQNAQGDQSTAASMASKLASADLDLVLAIATPTAVAAAQAITETPVLFTAVTDPVAAELVDSMEAPGANISGTTDLNPVAEQIALIKQVAPDAKTVGIVYSSGEINSDVQVKLAREAAAKEGLEVVEKTVTISTDVLQAVQALGDVDAIYVPTDNNVVTAIDSVIQVAEEKQIPVIAGEADSVAKGALITLGLDYYELGYQTGEMAVRILTEGADTATMPVEFQKKAKLVINTTAAERMGVTLSQELLDKADEKIS